jgi:threonine dehydratase
VKTIPSKEQVQKAMDTVGPMVHRTPVLQSRLLNALSGVELYFKCENFQRMGAFKMRGAINAISQLSAQQRAKGVVTHSSGNFAQAVALAAAELGVPAYIVMPSSAPQVKKTAVIGYGGKVSVSEPTLAAREAMASKIQGETGATFLHPSNDIPVILGQGTAAIELLEDHPELEVVLTPVGGGGLLAGTALAAHYYGNGCKVYAGEPMEADDAYRSLRSGKIETNESTNTVADGLRTQLGDNNFPIIQQLVEDIIRVEEDEIVAAMRLIWERMKIIIEPSCAVPFAAVLKRPELFAGKRVGIVLSGGNVDLNELPF